MGKAVSKSVKRKATFLLATYPEKFGKDFEKNKQVLDELGIPFSDQTRNWVAGFITRKITAKEAS